MVPVAGGSVAFPTSPVCGGSGPDWAGPIELGKCSPDGDW